MTTALYAIFGILLFGLLVGIHEFGHFAAAKLFGVRVLEFSLGMGPALWQRQGAETLYSLRLVPFGGYCAMMGEDEESADPRAFTNQAAWKRALILCAGAFMNFLLGLVIVTALYSGSAAFRTSEIADFMPGCPYESEAGLHKGDRFYKIDGNRVFMQMDVGDFLDQGSGVYDLVMIRDGEKVELRGFPMERIAYEGYSQKMYGFYFGYEEATPLTVVKNAWNTCMEFGRWVKLGLQDLIHGKVGIEEMSGPVAIVDLMAETGEAAETTGDAIYDIFYLTAFIAVNLALMNMLPLPALDGGRVFLLLVTWVIEGVTGRKLNPKYEGYIHAAGMVLLLALMAFIMFHDILRLVTR
jgi:regulator of sigma E protease